MNTPSLTRALRLYLASLESGTPKSPRTITEYSGDLRHFLEFAAGSQRSLSGIDRALLRHYQEHLTDLRPRNRAGRTITDRPGLAPATRRRRLVCLKGFLKFCAKQGWTPGDLGVHIDLPPLTAAAPRPISHESRARLDRALPSGNLRELRDRALILFLLSSGCRISEALSLDRADSHARTFMVGRRSGASRPVIVSPKARVAMKAYLAARQDRSPALFIGLQRQALEAQENRLTAAGANYACRQVARRLGMERWHPRQLRDTFGLAVEEELGDPRLTAELLGLKGIASVARYRTASVRRREEAAEALASRGF